MPFERGGENALLSTERDADGHVGKASVVTSFEPYVCGRLVMHCLCFSQRHSESIEFLQYFIDGLIDFVVLQGAVLRTEAQRVRH